VAIRISKKPQDFRLFKEKRIPSPTASVSTGLGMTGLGFVYTLTLDFILTVPKVPICGNKITPY
jgi:hypothetical protein